MAKNTRLATTVTARYFPSAGAVDAFYLDGRMNGRREEHFADITLDREDRGSFYAVYASSHGTNMPVDGTDGNMELLAKISDNLKNNSRSNIDSAISDLAETAVSVAGRLTLSDTTTIQPYFSGVIVKDGEIAAVTMGRACAYLYRDDALFPLTQDDLGFEAVDYYGKSLPNIGDFSAGVAGTLRYSNIAQLKANDCIILCNKEVMEIIGQRRMLQILDQAEDQSDAAGMVMGLATHEDNQTALQFMIGFVEDLIPLDRLGRSTLARGFAKLSRDTGMSKTAAKLPRTTGRTEFAQAANTEDIFANFAPGGSAAPQEPTTSSPTGSVAAATTAAVAASQAARYMRPESAAPAPAPTSYEPAMPVFEDLTDGREEPPAKPSAPAAPIQVHDLIADLSAEDDELLNSAPSGVQDIVNHIAKKKTESASKGAVSPSEQFEALSEEDRAAIDAALEKEGLGSFLKTPEDETDSKTPEDETDSKTPDFNAAFEETEIAMPEVAATPSPEMPRVESELMEESAKRVSLPEKRARKSKMDLHDEGDNSTIRKIAMVVLIAVAALLLIFVVYSLLFAKGESTQTTTTQPTVGENVITLPIETKTPVIVPTETVATMPTSAVAKPGGEYEVKSGDTVIGIIKSVYGVGETEAYNLVDTVMAANPGVSANSLSVGQVLKLPEIPAATTSTAAQ